jgi:integrase/recombinase XerC
LTYEELQRLLDYLDDRVDRIATMGRKGSASALRDALMIKTTYAYGLRRNELARLDLADLRPNPHMPEWGTYGAVHVRFGKSIKGSLPRRRTVLTVPEFDWIVPGLQQWIDQVRPLFRAADHPALWLTERLTRVNTRHIDSRFAAARDAIGLDPSLTLHCLRHSYVTHLVEFGYPERFVTEQVGHAYASTTAIYTSVSNDFKNKALQNALSRLYHPNEPRPSGGEGEP